MEQGVDNYTHCDWCFWYSHQMIIEGTGDMEAGGPVDTIQTTGARGVVVIAVGNEHGDTISNPGRDWLHFT